MQCGIVLALLTAATSFAQQPVANPAVAFETAAIHPAKLTNGCFSKLPPGGTQYALSCVTLKNLIAIAYNSDHIEGGGPALDAYYDLRATVPGDKPWTNESVALPQERPRPFRHSRWPRAAGGSGCLNSVFFVSRFFSDYSS